MYRITENDIRLLRRALVCFNADEPQNGDRILGHLRAKGIEFEISKDIAPDRHKIYMGFLPSNEQWLAEKYGYVWLSQYREPIFLPSKWPNYRALWIRSTEVSHELGHIGGILYSPMVFRGQEREIAKKKHADYQKAQKNVKAALSRVSAEHTFFRRK